MTRIMPRVHMQIYHVGDAELPAKFANLLTAIFQVIFRFVISFLSPSVFALFSHYSNIYQCLVLLNETVVIANRICPFAFRE